MGESPSSSCRMFETSDYLTAVFASQTRKGEFFPFYLKKFTMKEAVGMPPTLPVYKYFKLKLNPPSSTLHCVSYIKRMLVYGDGLELEKTGFPSVRTQLLLFPNRHP